VPAVRLVRMAMVKHKAKNKTARIDVARAIGFLDDCAAKMFAIVSVAPLTKEFPSGFCKKMHTDIKIVTSTSVTVKISIIISIALYQFKARRTIPQDLFFSYLFQNQILVLARLWLACVRNHVMAAMM